MLRPHQRDFLEWCRRVAAGVEMVRKVLCAATPGDGKSLLPQIAAKHLIEAGIIEGLVWFVPRASLREQGAQDFEDKFFRDLVGHNLSARETTAVPDPFRGMKVIIMTYEALVADTTGIIRQLFETKKLGLVLDEAQHVLAGSARERALQPLWDLAKVHVVMSGGLETHKRGERISFIRYGEPAMQTIVDAFGNPRQKLRAPVLMTDDDEWVCIKHSRREALAAGDILVPTHFRQIDGSARYVDRNGNDQEVASLAGETDEQLVRDGLVAAVQTSYAHDILRATFDHFIPYRQIFNDEGKALIVAWSQAEARKYLKWIKDIYPDLRAGIAISDDSEEARVNIRRFKKANKRSDALDVLVTVAMCYEGMSVPNATHLAALTIYRSKPWLEQMFARISRFNRKNRRKTVCYAFVPDDPFMTYIINLLKSEQPPAADELTDTGSGGGGGGGVPGEIAPKDSKATDHRETGDGRDDMEIDRDETSALDRAAKEAGIGGVSAIQLKLFVNQYKQQSGAVQPKEDDDAATPQTVAQQEESLRQRIEKWCRTLDAQSGNDFGAMNRRIVAAFGKPRPEMTLAELKAVWAWLNKEYGSEAA